MQFSVSRDFFILSELVAKHDEKYLCPILIEAYLVDQINHNLASGQYGSCWQERGTIAPELPRLWCCSMLPELFVQELGPLNCIVLKTLPVLIPGVIPLDTGAQHKMDVFLKCVFSAKSAENMESSRSKPARSQPTGKTTANSDRSAMHRNKGYQLRSIRHRFRLVGEVLARRS